MARRYTPEKREVKPDIRYQKIDVQEMINRIMLKGKKSTATRLMYDALDLIEERTGKDPIETFEAALKNVCVLRGDAMNTGLQAESMDAVLLFGVIPAPFLPLNRLLPEMHRILKKEGTLAIWPPVPVFLPRSINKSGLFSTVCKRKGVVNFKRIT